MQTGALRFQKTPRARLAGAYSLRTSLITLVAAVPAMRAK
jgi:hypothetical protein